MPEVMTWLRAGVPLTLLIDLLDESGPDSARIYANEGSEPADPWWTTAVVGNVAAQLTASEAPTSRGRSDGRGALC